MKVNAPIAGDRINILKENRHMLLTVNIQQYKLPIHYQYMKR